MKEFFARLNPTERRFVVGVGVVFFLVINIVWVWPHFGDWSDTKARMSTARTRLVTFETGTNLIPDLKRSIDKFGQGQVVPEENQGLNFARLVQNQTTLFGIIPQNMVIRKESSTGTTTTNSSFFVDQTATMSLDTTEKQLVDFLYSVGAGSNSLIRVKVLTVQPDASHQRLNARVTLVASYQKQAIGPVGTAAAGQKPGTTPQKPVATPSKPATTTPTPAKPIPVPAANNAKPITPNTPAKKPESNNRTLPPTNHFVPLARPSQPNPNTQ